MKKVFLFAFSWLTLSTALVACGNRDNGGGGAPPVAACPAGQLQSQWGCQPVNHCTGGSVYYGGYCQAAYGQNGYNGGQFGNGFGQGNGFGNGLSQACQVGFVPTQHGCLPQNGCPAGHGFLAQMNQCVPGNYGYGNGLPQPINPGFGTGWAPGYSAGMGYARVRCNRWGLCAYVYAGY
jgi:hypothetical protein